MNRIVLAILFALCLVATATLMVMDTKGQNIGLCSGLAAIVTTITGGNLLRNNRLC